MGDDRYTATASCSFCAWRTQMTGDDVVESGAFVRKLLLLHVARAHPDRTTAIHEVAPAPRAGSHYCRWDAPGRFLVSALCGATIRRVEHTNDPTCPTCARLLAELNEAVV